MNKLQDGHSRCELHLDNPSKQLNVDLENTITCYNPNDKVECGHCLSCITKLKALENV